MKLLDITVAALAAAIAGVTLALPAYADEHRGGWREEGRFHGSEGWREGGRWHEGERWHGGIERFHERDFHVWREGHWEHRYHDGRYGWWWFAGGLWYSYPTPVYPYPDPYVPPAVVAPPAVPAPPVVAEAPPAPQYWYYCDAAGGYYPYVPVCPSGWSAVPATPGY
jgi:hypothetical protein